MCLLKKTVICRRQCEKFNQIIYKNSTRKDMINWSILHTVGCLGSHWASMLSEKLGKLKTAKYMPVVMANRVEERHFGHSSQVSDPPYSVLMSSVRYQSGRNLLLLHSFSDFLLFRLITSLKKSRLYFTQKLL